MKRRVLAGVTLAASLWAASLCILTLYLNPAVQLHREILPLLLCLVAWAGLGASFGPVILLSLYWQQMTRNGALAGMVTGAVAVVVWKQLEGGLFDVYEILPAFIFATLAIVIVSSLGTGARRE